MRRHPGLWAVALVFAAASLVGRAWAADCPATMPLTLKEAQGGFVGMTGTIWSIRPDCTYSVSRFVNDRVEEPHLKGQLTPEQKAKLEAVLSEKAVAGLPAQVGELAKVNPHRISLDYDGKTSTLNLPPGTTGAEALKASSPDDPARRLVEVSEAIKHITGSAN
jgi:hypothetical protein